jgi:hypothetical protein
MTYAMVAGIVNGSRTENHKPELYAISLKALTLAGLSSLTLS